MADQRVYFVVLVREQGSLTTYHRKNRYQYQPQLPAGVKFIAGVDDVGRGPLAGPVLAAAVILDPDRKPIKGITDSKLLTSQQRETLFPIIQEHALAWGLGRAEVVEIDQLNIFRAGLLAMKRAIEALTLAPELVLIDGTHCPETIFPAQAIVKGDLTVTAISAASILAKVTRDREMIAWDAHYPGYGFAKNKGYGTPQHLTALRKLGTSPLHRQSFTPVKNILTIV